MGSDFYNASQILRNAVTACSTLVYSTLLCGEHVGEFMVRLSEVQTLAARVQQGLKTLFQPPVFGFNPLKSNLGAGNLMPC